MLGSSIFWTNALSLPIVVAMYVLLGRIWTPLFPKRFRPHVCIYLAPCLGMATLVIMASILGRYLPLGNSIVVPALFSLIIVIALRRDIEFRSVIRHTAAVTIVAALCGVSVLAPLYVFGGFNAHNDAFTYLVHANWLQENAFRDSIPSDLVSSTTSQVVIYQHSGLRMGASYLFAFVQSILNLRWSYEVYPTVVVSAMASCCMAIGFPLSRVFSRMSWTARLSMLALPGFSLGGLVFSANLGFLPQTIGIALGAATLFLTGGIVRSGVLYRNTHVDLLKLSIPVAGLLAGSIYAYSELMPFLVIACVVGGSVVAYRKQILKPFFVFVAMVAAFTAALLNSEITRLISALVMQSGVVVGSPVDWSLLGFIAHAFGLHGGAWDGFQWASRNNVSWGFYLSGLTLVLVVAVIVASGIRNMQQEMNTHLFSPTLTILFIFVLGIIYFRYFVSAPFAMGIGQSWSQFKLSDWAHPFASVILLYSLASWRRRFAKNYDRFIVTIALVGVVGAGLVSVTRVAGFMQSYSGTLDLYQFYLDFRTTVFTRCPKTAPVYLALGGPNHKFRQMASVFLEERDVLSDWTDDGYIFPQLPAPRLSPSLSPGDCVVEPVGQDTLLVSSEQIGPVRVGIFEGKGGNIAIQEVAGAYDRETDGKNWWRWVEREAVFKLKPVYVPNIATATLVRMEIAARTKQALTITLTSSDGIHHEIPIKLDGQSSQMFETEFDSHPDKVDKLTVVSDGVATVLSDHDPRTASFIIRNLSVTPIEHRKNGS